MPDGLSSTDYFRANLPQVEALKKRQLFDAMKNAAPQPTGSRVGIGSNGSLTGVKMPDADVMKPLTTPTSPVINVPTPDTSSLAQRQPVRMGIDLSGLKGSDRGLAQLQAMQDADREGLNTKTAGDFVETQAPRPKHLGLLEHLKNAGKDLVINMGQYAKTHPGASTGELLGAGGAGALVGGISPDAGDVLNRKYQIEQQQGDVANQLGIEGRQAQVVNEQNKPLVDLARIKAQTEKARADAEREDVKLKETAQYHKDTIAERTNRTRAERAPLLRERENGDGTKTTLKSTDNGATWAEVPELTSSSKPKDTQDYAQLRDWNYKKQGEASAAEKDLRQQADAIKIVTVDDEEKKKNLMSRADEAAKNVLKYRDEGDRAAAKIKMQSASSVPSPSTHVLNKKAWLQSHDPKDWPKAVAAAKSAGYQVVE